MLNYIEEQDDRIMNLCELKFAETEYVIEILFQSQDIFTGRMRPFSSNSRRSMQTTRLSPSVDPSGWRW